MQGLTLKHLALSLSLSSVMLADDLTLMDFINKKTDKINVIAEKDNEQLLKVGASGGTLFGDSDDKEALKEYCAHVGGTAVMSALDNDIYEPLFLGRHTNMDCKAANGKGFTATFFHPKYSSDKGFQNAWLHVKYESPQKTGYLMKNFIKRDGSGSSVESLKNRRGEYYTLEKGIAVCQNAGGKYLMSSDETMGFAISANDYYFAIADKLGGFKNEYATGGKHWCVDTSNKEDEFTVALSKDEKYSTVNFVPNKGVNQAEIKKSDEAIPPYFVKSEGDNTNRQIDFPKEKRAKNADVAMSSVVSLAEREVAERAIALRDTALSRQSGYVLEGIYLGKNSSGCHLAAAAKQTDRPYGHKYLYGSNDSISRIANFEQCDGYGIEFTGDSFERTFPRAIENEYVRTLGMCKVRGAAMSSYLGYNIDCARLGTTVHPVYEMTITKKDKLVLRALEQ